MTICKTDYDKILSAISIIQDEKLMGLLEIYLKHDKLKYSILKSGLDVLDKHNLQFLCMRKKRKPGRPAKND